MGRPSDASVAQAVAEIPDGTCMVNIYEVRRRAAAIDEQSEPAADFDCLALIDAARKQFRDSDAAGDVLDWLEEQYAVAITSRATETGVAAVLARWQSVHDNGDALGYSDGEREVMRLMIDEMTAATKATPCTPD